MRFLWNLYLGIPVGIPLYFSWISILFLWDFYWVLLWFPDMSMWFFMLIRWFFWWGSYGTLSEMSMMFHWCLFGVVTLCFFDGVPMPPFWDVHDVSWYFCGIPVWFPWYTHAIPMGFQCALYYMFMKFLWNLYSISMVIHRFVINPTILEP